MHAFSAYTHVKVKKSRCIKVGLDVGEGDYVTLVSPNVFWECNIPFSCGLTRTHATTASCSKPALSYELYITATLFC